MTEILKEVSEELGIPVNVVKQVMESYFFYIRTRITKVRYRNLDTLEGVKTNVLVPGFGKLIVKNKQYRVLTKKEDNGKSKC